MRETRDPSVDPCPTTLLEFSLSLVPPPSRWAGIMPMPAPMLPPSAPSSGSSSSGSGGTLVAFDGRPLPLRRADLRVRARGGLARTVLEQTFVNPHAEPLRVTYTLPLPADGAVSGFRFRIDDREVVGEVDRRTRARERFEEALVQGHTAAIVEQERSSVFTQEVGNIPPGATVVAMIEVDQPLAWRTDAGQGSGGWEYRFPTVVAPRYLGAEGRVADAARVEVAVADRRRPIAMSLQLRIDDALATGGLPASPSHALSLVREVVAASTGGVPAVPEAWTASLADESAGLDRDVVVRWPVATPEVGLCVDAARATDERATATDAFGLLTLVPPLRRPAAVPRDLIVLLDTSGSMHGEPLAQAQRIACALVDGLHEQDRIELIEFSTAPRRFHRKPLPATAKHREQAIAWIRKLSASGGTEMRTGILAALEGVRSEAQRQIVLVTDGHIGFEHEVLAEIAERLPAGSRVHTVGVGSSVNRSLTQAAARAGRGLELIVGIGEDPEPATVRLLARTEAPLVVDLELSGEALREHAPQRLPDLFAGSPALVAARLRPEGGLLQVRGRTAHGTWQAQVQVPARAPGEGSPGVVARFGREKLEDLELRAAVGSDGGVIDREIEELGVRFQIATRLTSWIAVSKEAMVDPGAPTRHEDVPQELPYGMSIDGLGLRMPGSGPSGAMPAGPMAAHGYASAMPASVPMPGSAGGFTAGAFTGKAKGAPTSVSANAMGAGRIGAAPPPPPASPAQGVPARPTPPAKSAAIAPSHEQAIEKDAKADSTRERSKESESVATPKKVARKEDAPKTPAPAFAEEQEPSPRDEALRSLKSELDGFVQSEAPAAPAPIPAEAPSAATGAFARLADQGDADAEIRGSGGAVPASAPMPSLGTLAGRVVLHRDGALVLEVDVRFAFAWRVPASLLAITTDGESVLVTLRTGTTAAAQLQPGMRLRLVIELPDGMPVPERLELELDGGLLTIAPIG
jgi:Ca-activated chloride channel family protein